MEHRIVLGIGNPLAGDDAVGPFVVQQLLRQMKKNENTGRFAIVALDAGTAPDNYTAVVRRLHPELLVIVDAADMGLPPGSLRRIAPDSVALSAFTTHSLPLSTFISYVGVHCRQIWVVGIQPQQTAIGNKLSPEVRKSAGYLVALILKDDLGSITLLP